MLDEFKQLRSQNQYWKDNKREATLVSRYVYRVNVQIVSIHREEHTHKQHSEFKLNIDTLPFFRFQHNHFECVFRSSILKLETLSVTGDIWTRWIKTHRLHSHLTSTTNTYSQSSQNAYPVEKQTRTKILYNFTGLLLRSKMHD